MSEDLQSEKIDENSSISALINNQQAHPHSNDHAASSIQGSQLLPKYMEIMNISHLKQCEERRNTNMRILIQQGLQFDEDSKADLKVTLTEWSQDYQYVLLNVSYSHFLFYVSLLNVDHKSPMHQIKECFTGNFSSVYRVMAEGTSAAVKCNTYTRKSFLRVFKNSLQEYLAYQIVSKLNSGPKMPKIYGFDMLVYSDCIEYSMEFCRQRLKAQPCLEIDLKKALRNLHSLNIIHFDIKPDNICFSEQHSRYVFIDLGLHKVIAENIGEKTDTNYQGSLLFCSEEMRDCFLNGRRSVDLYYNDALCLEESLKEIKKMKKKKNIPEDISDFSQTQFMMTVKMKYLLTHSRAYETFALKASFFSNLNSLRGDFYQSIKHFLYNLNYSTRLEEIIIELGNYSQQFRISSLISKKITQAFIKENEKEQETTFEIKMKFLQKLNKSATEQLEIQAIKEDNLKEYIIFLCDEEKVKKWEDKLYYLFVSEIIQMNSWRATIEEKEQLCDTFNRLHMKIPDFQKLNIEQKTKNCLQCFLRFILKQTHIDCTIYQIIKHSLLGTLFMQIFNQQDYLSLMKELISMQCNVKLRIRLIYFVLSCLQWLLYHSSTSYCYFYMKNQFYRFILGIFDTFKEDESERVNYLVNLLKKLIQPSTHQTKDKMLKQKINQLHQKLHFKIVKYYVAINQYQQILAEILAYYLYLYLKQERMTFKSYQKYDSYLKHNEILVLVSHQNHIFNYFQFVTDMQDHPNVSSFRYQKMKDLCSYYKSFAFQYFFAKFNSYQIINNTIYFNDIDCTQFNPYFALLYRKKMLYFYYSIILVNNKQAFSIDRDSFRKNCLLREVKIFIPYLKQITSYEISHQHEFSFCYKSMLLSIQQYRCLHIEVQYIIHSDYIQRIQQEMANLLEHLSCCYCKANCLISNLLPMTSNTNIRQFEKNDEYIQNMAIWLMKEPSLFANIRLVFMKNLCRIIGKRSYSKLFIDHLIENNITIEFLPLDIQEAEITERVNILISLWDHQDTYFQFILSLCKSFNFLKRQKQSYLKTFTVMIETLCRSKPCHQGFFEANYKFLEQNKTRLRQIPYMSIYFGILLLNLRFIFKDKIKPFYYNFVWSSYHKLSFEAKNNINNYVLHNFIKNQVYHYKPKTRRLHFLQRFHVRNYLFSSLSFKEITKRHKKQLQALRIKLGNNDKFLAIKECIRRYYTVQLGQKYQY